MPTPTGTVPGTVRYQVPKLNYHTDSSRRERGVV